MFDKIISILPYNPSLVHQLAFYSRRMRQEALVRRTGFVFIALAFLVQFFAVIAPPASTSADSNNDLIEGGFTTPAEAQSDCDQNIRHYKDIMYYYGINCVDLGHAETVTIKSTDTKLVGATVQHLFSMGHLAYGATNPNTGKPTYETKVDAPGATVYVRHLQSFDTGAYSSYKALHFTAGQSGKEFYILYACGNLTSFGVPTPYTAPTPTPAPKPTPAPTPTPTPAPTPTPTPAPTPAPTPTPTPAKCPYNSSVLASDTDNCYCKYNTSLSATDTKCVQCKYNNTIIASDTDCKPCTSLISSEDLLACLQLHKTVADPTAGFTDANGKTAQPGDTLVYTLTAYNSGKQTVKGFIFTDNISDTLDYSDVVDLHGGALDSSDQLSWPAVDIKGGETATELLTVQVKNPIPATPVSTSDPGHFDLTMTNVFNNATNVHVPAPVVKAVEIQTTRLVNTGPGTSLFVGAIVMIAAGYFYSRARLLASESDLVVKEHTSGGF